MNHNKTSDIALGSHSIFIDMLDDSNEPSDIGDSY
jgi:hypothetical protein